MPQRVILLSGPVASGKTTLGDLLIARSRAVRFKTNEFIARLRPAVNLERAALQAAGEALDRSTQGRWVCDELVRASQAVEDRPLLIVDCVRIALQIDAIRQAYGSRVVHIHLTASADELAKRYRKRGAKFRELPSYREVRQNATERDVEDLAKIADVVIDTDRCTQYDVMVRAEARLNLYPRAIVPSVDVIVGGQYGSEGKGNIVSYIAKEYHYLMRVGGPNAGHKVFGRPPYTFHHLPSGTLRSNANLIIGPGAVLNVEKLLTEIEECRVTPDRLSIDPQAMTIEPRDIALEKRRLTSISSTAQGVGQASARRITGRGTKGKPRGVRLAEDIRVLSPFVRPTAPILQAAYLANERVLLEGTQGTSLSIYHGQYPWVTSRDTSVSGCISEAGVSPRRVRKIIMVCRTYPIRVGGPSGPMGQKITKAEIARRSGLSAQLISRIERTSTTNRPRRIAEFSWDQLRRATILNGPTDIALTFADYIRSENEQARRFEQLTPETVKFIEEVEHVSGVPVSLISTRFHWRNIIDRRAW